MSKSGSSLARQLRTIAQQNQTLGGYTHNQFTKRKASLLFDEREAADIDTETIYEIGMKGLTGLCELEPFFLRYQALLFSQETAVSPEALDRSLRTAEENRQLDGHLRSFLRQCQPFFLERCCQQALEWLIRAYRINELNVPDVLDAILPYHETAEFVRLVQILFFRDPSDDPWAFLFGAVKQGASGVTREFLAKRALVDRRLLESTWAALRFFLGKWTQCSRTPSPAFHAMLCCEYLGRAGKIDMAVTAGFFLPMSLEMIGFGDSADVQLAGLLVAGSLAERAPLSTVAAGDLARAAARLLDSDGSRDEALLFLERLVRLYPQAVDLSPALVEHPVLGVDCRSLRQSLLVGREATMMMG